MKHKDNCEQLFEYLRSILYDDKVNALQIDDLEPAWKRDAVSGTGGTRDERIFCGDICGKSFGGSAAA